MLSTTSPGRAGSKSPQVRDVLRVAGAAVGVFVLANLLGELVRPPFDTLADWVSAPDAPWLRHLLAALLAATLVAGPFVAARPRLLARAGAVLTLAVAGVALVDSARFYQALARGRIHTPAVVPASLLVALFFLALAGDHLRPLPPPPASRTRTLLRLLAAAAVLVALPLVRMATFGPTRYERRAAAAVVFGARVYADGRPSLALADRVDTAIDLYRRGRVRALVMSGGIDPHNGRSEPEVMRARAEAAGVPREAVLLDEEGVDTRSTVRNVARLMEREGLESALVVSHYYHEPRAKMLFDRAGVRGYTVPAKMKRRLLLEPYYIAREVAAYWNSFLRQ